MFTKRNLPEKYFNLLIELEGGYSNHKSDRGGETKYGITKNLVKRLNLNYDIENLTLQQAYDIYNKYFWNKYKCYEYPLYLDYVVFDSFVNHGSRGARYRLKELVNRLKFAYPNLILSNVNTLDYNKLHATILNYYMEVMLSPLLFADELLLIRMNFYYRFVSKYPSQKIFLQGWIKRLKVIMDKLPEIH